ncbi:TetR/AcrR family transcriptional regulator [Companilactobacillus sp.]|jgi:AcrR family transcriptional regulator|uniref:TetR/AcrR family transcriptional regulator n=1 Tax=Companilactobacillus sp. TaxID=2767905 RepID=UPI0025BE7E1F|nr:TetR/AcrR family transcriptional regulator [Companilactobacillus sp.]MCH4007930.1 TetR/AcrR family transcriptional regulator [Companilactobacillus sp.]MCH4051891.1 TetR/AcrR family transcriptional regulator [Companilactobacillus sp.]MCH4075873.1 TetR/AcrR family transcriptional regulator [Companilactobacillus sp.]MCH4124448.1 TetR/AcrR family transcriptional regulator [Companilactobacillus sp.]MCH4132589.1 TetR/AcrR family transcriptional regulator [Companilactobacillus sp.]
MTNIYTLDQKNAKRQAIMKAAVRLFKTKGYSEITMKRIAETIGISKGTTFNYFSTKEDLFMSILLESYQQFFADLLIKMDGYESIDQKTYINFMVEQTENLIQNYDVLVRLNSIRGPILEGNANMDETVVKRNDLYEISKKLGQKLVEKTNGLLNQMQFSHMFVIQSGIISGLMNMSSLAKFNHEDLKVDYPDFEIKLVPEAQQQMRYYLTEYLKELKKNE